MGLVYAEIEIINGEDLSLSKRNVLDRDDVRSIRINALVDSGSYMLAINESIQEQLQLPVVEKRKAQFQ